MSDLSDEVVITAVLNGPAEPSAPWPHHELAVLARRAHDSGSAIVQVHIRDELTGEPSCDLAVARHVTAQEIAKLTPVLVEPSMQAAGGGQLIAEELTVAHVRLVSLDPLAGARIDEEVVAAPEGPARIAEMLRAAGVKAVFEVRGPASLAAALKLLGDGPIGGPAVFSFDGDELFGLGDLPDDAAFETRRPALYAEALGRGGHLHVPASRLERAVDLARSLGRTPASVEAAAAIWRIPVEHRSNQVRLLATGRRSGEPRPTQLTYRQLEGDRLVLVGSGAGSPTHPQWALNLLATPEVVIERDGRRERRLARWVEGQERELLWSWIVSEDRGQLYYQRKSGREFPVIVLEPVSRQER